MPANGAGASNPFRLDRSQAATADQDHDYTPEQQAFDGGLMDLFPQYTGTPDRRRRPRRSRYDHGADDGLLRRQHRDRTVELRPALCDERQLVRHELWSFDAGRHQSDLRPDQRRRDQSNAGGDVIRMDTAALR